MRRSRLFMAIAMLSCVFAGAALWQWRGHERDGSAALARGIAAFEGGDARTARVELMNAIKRDPRSAKAHLMQARVLVELGEGAGAASEVARARALGVQPAQSRDVMAQAMLLQGDAIAAMQEASAPDMADPQRAVAARIRASAAIMLNDGATARSAIAQAMAIAPGDAENWIALARLNMASGDEAGAIRAGERAATLAPRNVRAMTLRAELIRRQYGLLPSLPAFERALALDPNSVPTMEAYAATLADAGRAGAMLALTRRILTLDPDNARAWMMQAVMAARAEQDDLARTMLARTRGRLDSEPATRLLRGILQLRDGNAVLAVEALAPLVREQPDNRVASTLLARAYYDAGDFASAATMLAPIVAQRDAEPYILTLAARAQEALGDRAMADDMLTRAAWPLRPTSDIFARPDDERLGGQAAPANAATALDNVPYIRALIRQGRGDEAIARADLLARSNAGAPGAWIVLGDTLEAAGRVADAGQAHRRAADIRFDRGVAMRLAAAWSRAGDIAQARQVLAQFSARNPGDVPALRLAASAAMEAREWRTALRLLRAIRARIGNGDAMVMADMARVMVETGDASGAVPYAALAYRLAPADPRMADLYGWSLMKSGAKGAGATDLLDKALALTPGSLLYQLHLAQAQASVGRRAEAKATLTRLAGLRDFVGRQEAARTLAQL